LRQQVDVKSIRAVWLLIETVEDVLTVPSREQDFAKGVTATNGYTSIVVETL
jgi:hypothetical protein